MVITMAENNDKNCKQVIVLRRDLNMRKGKLIAQGAHASMKVLLAKFIKLDDKSFTYQLQLSEQMDNWINGLFTKIVVGVSSEQELLDIYAQAKAAGLPCSLIKDVGLTEFKNIPTYTAVAIGPADSSDIDQITKHLTLL